MESIVKILYLNVFDGDELGLICCSCEILRYNISSDINIYGSETGQILDNYVNTMTVDALAHCVTRTSAAMGLNMPYILIFAFDDELPLSIQKWCEYILYITNLIQHEKAEQSRRNLPVYHYNWRVAIFAVLSFNKKPNYMSIVL